MDSSRPFGQRLFERSVGIIGVFVLWPTVLLACLLIRATSDGPVIITDEFPASHGGIAHSFRLRTTGRGTTAVRVIGRFLRNYAIDELPVFWSLARGDVGLRDALRCLGYR
jgi:lipopolysaccharide/colanic/teichoic acid biosynthesis glycosyltransferase